MIEHQAATMPQTFTNATDEDVFLSYWAEVSPGLNRNVDDRIGAGKSCPIPKTCVHPSEYIVFDTKSYNRIGKFWLKPHPIAGWSIMTCDKGITQANNTWTLTS